MNHSVKILAHLGSIKINRTYHLEFYSFVTMFSVSTHNWSCDLTIPYIYNHHEYTPSFTSLIL